MVAAGLLLSKPTGYLRDALLAARFGTGRAMDAYSVAYTAAVAAFDIVGAPLQRVVVPVLVRARERRGPGGLAATSGAILWAVVLASLALGAVLLLGAGPVAALLAGHGRAAAQTAVLLRWLSPLPLAMALSAYASAWLQAGRHFALPAFVGLPLDLAIIGLVLFTGHSLGILAAAWGLLLGTLLQFALQWPGLRAFGHRVDPPSPRAWGDPGLQDSVGMALPLLVSAASVQAVNVLQQALAARLATGSAAALIYAYRVLDLPAALFVLPVVTVIVPRLAAQFSAGSPRAAARTLRETAWALGAGLLPCTLLLGLLAAPLAAALYEHGAFNAASVAAMARGLVGFAPAVVCTGMQQLLRASFYARQDARTPMLWDLAALAASAAFDLATYRLWHELGLALGLSFGSAVAWAGLALRLRRERGLAGRDEPESGPRWPPLVAGAAALVVTVLLCRELPPFLGTIPWRRGLAAVAVGGTCGAVAYTVVTVLTGGGGLLRRLVGAVRPGS